MTNQQTNSDFFVNLFLGGVSKGISKTLQAPFERVQLLLQTQDANKKIQDGVFKKYNGIGNCFMRIPKEEGWMAFFRGNLPNVIRYFPSQIMNFAFKDQYRKIFSHYNPRTEHFLFFLENLASGGAAGATTLLVVYPLDFARVRLAVDIGRGTDRQFQGLWNCLTSIQKSDGYIGLYRGFGVSVLGIVAYRAIYFGAYDTAKATVFKLPQFDSFFMKFAVSYFITFSAGALSYPLDTIRKRMMMQSGRTDVLYANSIDCAKKIFRIEGIRGFFKGFLMNFLQGFSGIFLMWFDKKS